MNSLSDSTCIVMSFRGVGCVETARSGLQQSLGVLLIQVSKHRGQEHTVLYSTILELNIPCIIMYTGSTVASLELRIEHAPNQP